MTADWQKPMKTLGKTGKPLDAETLRMSTLELMRVVDAARRSAQAAADAFREFGRVYDDVKTE